MCPVPSRPVPSRVLGDGDDAVLKGGTNAAAAGSRPCHSVPGEAALVVARIVQQPRMQGEPRRHEGDRNGGGRGVPPSIPSEPEYVSHNDCPHYFGVYRQGYMMSFLELLAFLVHIALSGLHHSLIRSFDRSLSHSSLRSLIHSSFY